MKKNKPQRNWLPRVRKLSPQLSLALSFLTLILIGTVLLALPISREADGSASWIDALFTATSATCVTGLITVDTGSYWSTFGQMVILVLIQLGGLGIMTFSTFVVYLVARRLSLWNRDMLEQSVAGISKSNVGHLLLAIILITFLFEIIGATILTFRFAAIYPLDEAIYISVFHSISAFCNAGFSLFDTSFIDFRNDLVINLTVMILIILGGIGFWVLVDLKNLIHRKRAVHSTSLHTRLVIYVSLILIVIGTLLLLGIEWNHSLRHLHWPNKLLVSAFQSVTARTAGFNTVDMAALTNASLLLLILLMVIGASPGSCGGGIKTSTLAVTLAMIFARLRNKNQVQLLQRGIPDRTVSRSIGITFFFIVTVALFCMLLLITEHPSESLLPERSLFIQVVFEVASAIGTVGLSMGLTPHLTEVGKVLISILMFVGRIGPVTLVLALSGTTHINIRYAEDNVWVG